MRLPLAATAAIGFFGVASFATEASAHVKWFCAFNVAGQPRGLENVLCADFEGLVGLAVPRDSREASLLDELPVCEDDLVLSKTSSSPFNSTSIDRFLRNLDIDTLLVCGVVSNGCVEGTIRDASDLGYQVVMVEDACAAVTPALHQAAITNLKDAFCNCRTTGDVMEELDRH